MERGETIAGRYELVKRLGRGGMGEVWAGRDRSLQRDVAIKVLVPDNAAFQELAWRFEREAVAAAQISHANVVALYDRGVHEDVLFLVMEKVEGATLAEHISDESPMDPSRAVTIAQDICAALIAAHRAGVIHYDIKPHNVMLTPDGQVKVVDFGIAGFVQTAFALARSSQLSPAGTVEYGAPEQFLTERGDERSDLYALGSVLFALLVGRPPFTGHHVMAVLRRKLDEDAPRVDSLRPHLPPALTTLVAELLARDPARRPSSAAQTQERLGRLRAELAAREGVTAATVDLRSAGGGGEFGAGGSPAASRAVVLAQVAGVMQAVVTQRSTPLQSAQRSIVPQPSPRSAPAAAHTRPSSRAARPFQMSWTGTEAPTTYAVRRDADKHSYWFWTALWSPVAVAGTSLSLQHTGSEAGVWQVIRFLWPFLVLIAVGCLIEAVLGSRKHAKEARALPQHAAWTLQVGPHSIVTAGVHGRREFAWDQIRSVSIEEIDGTSPYRFTGVHVQLVSSAGRPRKLPPAGWPHPESTITIREQGKVPICVLGPMTGQQRIALTEALARHGGG
ncbi:serine/threonine-protein kinase [Streptomyces sp. NPDC006733]|uniref:serine/threonine-protein kinase n=1 Tax=Streptomyces sp. NPDC006733 TaxID=3155460 RepID=UPI0033C875CA